MKLFFLIVICLVLVSAGVAYAEIGDNVVEPGLPSTPVENLEYAPALSDAPPLGQEASEPAIAEENMSLVVASLGSIPTKMT